MYGLMYFRLEWNSDGIIKQDKLSVMKAVERSLNGRKFILRFNVSLQPIRDGVGLLSGEMFHSNEDIGGRIKKFFLHSLGKSWKETRGRLYDSYYKPTRMLEENLEDCPTGQNALNRSKQLYTYTDGLIRLWYKLYCHSQNYRRVELVEEKYGSYSTNNLMTRIYLKKLGGLDKISEDEQRDEFTRLLSENDSLGQAPEREHSGRVCVGGFGPTPSQLFCLSLQPPVDRVQAEKAQRMLIKLQAEVTAEKLKRKVVEDEVAAEKLKMKTMEDEIAA
ncbi:hypothetical protein Ahy_A05g022116 [Arachis hypogaea]|uniref:Uncharacterized protein n=1 Tax=Arachis hypogaea TaxID=3818 RepID=A0A445CZP6_ARAHY|nr:hypothetical protein Ahy_A05g022116 [Arachis hypogaea]